MTKLIRHLVVVPAMAVLWVGCLVLAFSTAALPVRGAGAVLRVPLDYSTIQAAIDAASDGDEIRVEQSLNSDTHIGTLYISKSITLSGGWDLSGTVHGPHGTTLLNGNGAGRVISITAHTPGMLVTIERMHVVLGDATGLGGLDASALPGGGVGEWVDTGTMPGFTASRLASVHGVAATALPAGLMSAGEAARWNALAEKAAGLEPAATRNVNVIDCGGGLYSSGAALTLLDSSFEANLASRTGSGAGGAVCIVGAAGGRVVLRGNIFELNDASQTGTGFGGALYLAGTDNAEVTHNRISNNVATYVGDTGIGGGLFVTGSRSLQLAANEFRGNTGSVNLLPGSPAVGGGAYIVASENVTVTANLFEGNIAGLYGGGGGGGLYLFKTDAVTVSGNAFQQNRAVLNMGALGLGGGLGLGTLTRAAVVDNEFVENLGAGAMADRTIPTATGGAIFAATVEQTRIDGNHFFSNTAAAVNTAIGQAIAGALQVDAGRAGPSSDISVRDNVFANNLGTMRGLGYIGAAFITAIRPHIAGNRFVQNAGCRECEESPTAALSVRGALEATTITSADAIVDGNLFESNGDAGSRTTLSVATTEGFTITNNLIVRNQGEAGLSVSMGFPTSEQAEGWITNNTFYAAGGSALLVSFWNSSAAHVVNNIVVSHTMGVSVTATAQAELRYTLFNQTALDIGAAGVVTNTAPITGAVRFVDAAASDLRLQPTSAAVDAGDPAGIPPAPAADINGTPRPSGARVDVGAYEWHGPNLYFPNIFK